MTNENRKTVAAKAMVDSFRETLRRKARDYCNAKYNCRVQEAKCRILVAQALGLDQTDTAVY